MPTRLLYMLQAGSCGTREENKGSKDAADIWAVQSGFSFFVGTIYSVQEFDLEQDS